MLGCGGGIPFQPAAHPPATVHRACHTPRVTPADLARLAAVADRELARCATKAERTAARRMAWALVRAISARGAGDGGHLEQRGGEVHREAGSVIPCAVEQGKRQVAPHPGDDGGARKTRQQPRGQGLPPGGKDQHGGGVGLRRD